jgi:hypothetical protein
MNPWFFRDSPYPSSGDPLLGKEPIYFIPLAFSGREGKLIIIPSPVEVFLFAVILLTGIGSPP